MEPDWKLCCCSERCPQLSFEGTCMIVLRYEQVLGYRNGSLSREEGRKIRLEGIGEIKLFLIQYHVLV